MKRKLAIGIVVSAIFLYLAMRGIVWGDFAEVFRTVNYWYLAPCVFFTMVGYFVRANRWKFMLLPVKTIGTWSLFSATSIGFMFNNLLPARLGEFVRAYAIGKSESISKSAAFATIVYERVVDVFVLIILLWLSLLRISGPDWLRRSGFILIAFNVALLALLFLMVLYKTTFNALLEKALKPFPGRIRDRVRWSTDSFVEGLAVLRKSSTFLPIALTSLVVWGGATLGVYFCLLAVHMETPLMTSVVLIVLTSLGSMIPSAPAYIGTMQYACIVGLSIYGIDNSQALAYSTVYHATQFFPITFVGLLFAWRSQIRFGEISDKKK